MSSDAEPQYVIGQAEQQYQRWCKDNYLDPEDVGSMLAYEATFDNE